MPPTTDPKYRPGQMLRFRDNKSLPSRPVVDVKWDEAWGFYTYLLPLALIRELEYHLEPTGEPDMTPEEWIEQWERDRIANIQRRCTPCS